MTLSQGEVSLNFMAEVNICSIFGAPKNKVCQCFHCFPTIFHEVMGLDAINLVFWMLSLKPAFHSPLSVSSGDSSVSLCFLPWGWCHLYIWCYDVFSCILIPGCASSSPPFSMMKSESERCSVVSNSLRPQRLIPCRPWNSLGQNPGVGTLSLLQGIFPTQGSMQGSCNMYSAYKLNKQSDNIPSWHSPFPIWNQSIVPRLVLTVSWSAERFVRRQVRWSCIAISFRIFQFVVIYIGKGIGIVNKAKADVFLELSCFFSDPRGVGNFITGSSAFSKSSLKI